MDRLPGSNANEKSLGGPWVGRAVGVAPLTPVMVGARASGVDDWSDRSGRRAGGVGEKLPVAPVGRPLTLNVTLSANPFVGVIAIA
jgi:hypothetical protein